MDFSCKIFTICISRNIIFVLKRQSISVGSLQEQDKVIVFNDAERYCYDHEDQEHHPYCWDYLLLYVQTLNTAL